MEASIYLIVGTVILFATLSDFFYTTLSGSGAGFIAKACAAATNETVLKMEKLWGNKVFQVSGLLVNLTVLAVWVVLVWLGLFLVYSFDAEAIVNSSGVAATHADRLYYTGYVLSTLGIGNFYPSSQFQEIVTSVFSFFGFVFFTTTMTYLLSVSSAVIHKNSLAMSIRNLGENPAELMMVLQQMDTSFSFQQIANLEQMIIKNSVNYQAYPVLHFYHHPNNANTISINIAVLDEALSMMLSSELPVPMHKELSSLRSALTAFLDHLQQRFNSKADEHPAINGHNVQLPQNTDKKVFMENQDIKSRRKVLTSILCNENRTWENVYAPLAK